MFQMYPQDRVVPVGANTTFCCIVQEGADFSSITYSMTLMNATRLSRRSYAITALNQTASGDSGTNVFCRNNLENGLTGTVVIVGCKMTHNNGVVVLRWSECVCQVFVS